MNTEINQIVKETEKENSAVAEIMKLAIQLKEENGKLKEDKKVILKYYEEICIAFGRSAYISEIN